MADSIERNKWKLHPEVISFWENAGKSIRCYGGELSSIYFYVNPNGYIPTKITAGDDNLIAIFWENEKTKIVYCFNNEFYSEEKMLRIIRMKAFM